MVVNKIQTNAALPKRRTMATLPYNGLAQVNPHLQESKGRISEVGESGEVGRNQGESYQQLRILQTEIQGISKNERSTRDSFHVLASGRR